MAYTAPPNFVTAAVVVESELDTLSDDITFLANPPKCRVYNSAAFSHTSSGNWLTVTLNSERQDNDTMHSTVTNTGRITFTTAGFYIVGGHLQFAANGTGVRGGRIRLNGTTVLTESPTFAGDGTNGNFVSPPPTGYQFAAGDYIEMQGYQSSGGNLNVNATGNESPEFWAIWQSL